YTCVSTGCVFQTSLLTTLPQLKVTNIESTISTTHISVQTSSMNLVSQKATSKTISKIYSESSKTSSSTKLVLPVEASTDTTLSRDSQISSPVINAVIVVLIVIAILLLCVGIGLLLLRKFRRDSLKFHVKEYSENHNNKSNWDPHTLSLARSTPISQLPASLSRSNISITSISRVPLTGREGSASLHSIQSDPFHVLGQQIYMPQNQQIKYESNNSSSRA
ncbi:hypothetical protein HK096_010874, partial [Nowakowskiella sp. JEL0078]